MTSIRFSKFSAEIFRRFLMVNFNGEKFEARVKIFIFEEKLNPRYMLVQFEDLPETSRVWVYQSNRSFTDKELEEIKVRLEDFIQKWTAHGADLQASYEIKYKRFIILALDQEMNKATGCSIDASVNFIQQLEKDYQVDLLDKMNVSYRQGEFIAYKSLTDFRKMAKDKAVSPRTIVFNNLVNNKAEYLSDWEVPASESWHKRFLN